MSYNNLHSTLSPSKLIFSSDLYKNTKIILDPSHNTTLHSRQGKNLDLQDTLKPKPLSSRYSILSSHLEKEKSRSATAALNKMKIDSVQSQRNFELKSQIQHRRVKSDLVNQKFIQSRASKASELNRNVQGNYEKAILTQICKQRQFLQSADEKVVSKPQRFANTLNKPGVTVWMNLAAGGRIRSASLELPAPDAPRVLRTWDIFSGFTGSEAKQKKEMEVEMQNPRGEQRGFCCKIDPIYQSYSYNQALYYLQLRKKGLCKSLAIQLSQKIHCNLHDRQVMLDKSDPEKDQDYQKLVDRFSEYTNQHPIRDGEIVQDEEYHVKNLKLSTKDPLLCKPKYFKAKTEPTDSKQAVSVDTSRVKPKQDQRLLELKKILRQSKLNKSGSIHQPSDRNEEAAKSRQDLPEDCKSFETLEESQTETRTSVGFSKDKAVKFLINSILPKRRKLDDGLALTERPQRPERSEIERFDDELQEMLETQDMQEMRRLELIQAQDRLETIHEGTHEDNLEVQAVQFGLPRSLALLDKARRSKERLPAFTDKGKKTIEKKEEIVMQSNQMLQETLARKLDKLKSLAEQRKREKQESLHEIQKRKHEFVAKVQSMKSRKEKLSEAESEQVLKRVRDKFETAEANKRRLEVEKERRREEQRLLYQSQRSFVEYLRSLSYSELEA